MNCFKPLLRKLQALCRNSSGNTGILYALSAVPILLGAGAAIDYARHTAAKTHVQAALDAGALAGAAMLEGTDAQRIAAAEAAYDANIKSGAASGLSGAPEFKVVEDMLIASAEIEMETSLMRVAGIETMTIGGYAEVGIAVERNAEVALVLDYSGSMGETSGGKVKYVAMREAATSLINDLNAKSPGKVKFGLVPFSHHVRVTLPGSHVLGAGGGSWTGCTQDRQYPHNLSDNTPSSADATKWGQPVAPDHAAWGCSGYVSNNLAVRPLTDKVSTLTSQLAAMTPYAWTHIALGVEFGYHLLSPNAPFTEAKPYSDEETRKFMIVLTDGMQTEPAFGPGSVRNVAQGEENLEALCDNVKKDGITIITLAFDLDDTSTRQRLKACASDPSNFFVADDDTDLMQAFEAIKLAIATDIYLSK
jgi:Flp pilus assembly protein TadG